ncbi:hypothetical protein ISU10_04850 [Nocardioides agariphilus]|jgi:hypothetical protein|uniref:Uncharacterized protein n=1 Tax=Nocardioides agariphilus TaxID=433664 RepID=A0A930VM00_9ACTN|nr:hypothetical protein [Nocardioides agariphilus]MBF4767091.1 hypothetical protein [Nocardioides agariphilus]
MQTGPPPWVRYPTPLEGRWVSDVLPEQVTLVIKNASLDIYRDGADRPGRAPYVHRSITVRGDRLYVREPDDNHVLVSYAWRIAGDDLTFELLDATAPRGLPTGDETFSRS